MPYFFLSRIFRVSIAILSYLESLRHRQCHYFTTTNTFIHHQTDHWQLTTNRPAPAVCEPDRKFLKFEVRDCCFSITQNSSLGGFWGSQIAHCSVRTSIGSPPPWRPTISLTSPQFIMASRNRFALVLYPTRFLFKFFPFILAFFILLFLLWRDSGVSLWGQISRPPEQPCWPCA